MNSLIMGFTVVVLLLLLVNILRPLKVLNLYVLTRTIIHPFIFLQYKFASIPYSWIWAVIMFVVYGLHIFRRDWKIVCYKGMPLLVLLLLSAFSMLFTVDIRASIEGVIKLLVVFTAYGIAYNAVKTTDDVRKIAKALVWAALVPLVFGFYQSVTGNYDQIAVTTVKRVNSVFGVGNAYGIFLSVVMCAAIAVIATSEKRKERWFYFSFFAAMLASQLLALNRGTWIAYAAGLFIAVLRYRRRLNMKVIITLTVFVSIFASGLVYKRFTEVRYTYDGKVADTFQGRLETWKSLGSMIAERPLRGYGVNSLESMLVSDHPIAPHNDYVRFAFELGVLGALVYAFFFCSMTLFFLRRSRVEAEFWPYNFSLLILIVYVGIISGTQNIVYNLTNYVFFVILSGAVVKLNVLAMNNELPVAERTKKVMSGGQ